VITGGSHKTNMGECFTVTLTTEKTNYLANDTTEQLHITTFEDRHFSFLHGKPKQDRPTATTMSFFKHSCHFATAFFFFA
jgi:hypothetical protein